MKGDIIPGIKAQSFALKVMEQRPYSAYMTVDEENSAPRALGPTPPGRGSVGKLTLSAAAEEAAIEGVFADRRTMRAQDRAVAIENQQVLEERDMQSLCGRRPAPSPGAACDSSFTQRHTHIPSQPRGANVRAAQACARQYAAHED